MLKRMGAIYSLDERAVLRKSHENPSLQRLYKEFLGEPGGELAHELLHTTYTDRSHTTVPAYSVAERGAVTGRQAPGRQYGERQHQQREPSST